MFFWSVIVAFLLVSTIWLYSTLEVMREMEERTSELRNLIQPLEKEKQSGMWIFCAGHGSVPLTQVEFDKQTKKESYHCPFCGQIPRKIWRKV
jgi:hypothetical protein